MSAARRARFVFEPLTDWPYPEQRRVESQFSAPWTETRDLLLAEADHLGAALLVVELDLSREDLRQDGEIRANARLSSGRVRVSMDTRHGALRYACDRFLPSAGGGLGRRRSQPAWQHNLRAIALTLQALRAVDRYGAVHSAEQYQGFRAIEATPTAPFTNADSAERWLRARTDSSPDTPTDVVARRARAAWHPDRTGGDRVAWDLLEQAVDLMRAGGLL